MGVLESNGAVVQEAKLPEGPWEAAAGTVISVEGAAAFESLIESGNAAELKLPIGIELMARALEENKVVQAARLFQQHTRWHTVRPPV